MNVPVGEGERSGHPADPPSTGASSRCPYPGCLPGLLPDGDPAASTEDAGSRADAAGSAGKTGWHPNAGRVFPTTDGRRMVMPRFTEPSPEQALLLHHLNLVLPQQPPPRITMPASTVPCPQLKM